MTIHVHIVRLLFIGIALAACRAADPPPRDVFDQRLANQLPSASYETRQKVRKLLHNTLTNLAFIEGGKFIIGDWGAVGGDGIWRPYFPPSSEENKAHQVQLSSYSLSKYKVTWEDYDTFLLAIGTPPVKRAANLGGDFIYDERKRLPYEQDPESSYYIKNPARDRWQDAEDYCLWLAEMTGVSFSLPTNAQYEYAARNRGKKWLFATHDGNTIEGSSHPYTERIYKNGPFGPVGSRLPANPLGLYDMGENAEEWVKDWFSPTYYSEHPIVIDPQGPFQGTEKTIRALGVGSLAFSFVRSKAPAVQQNGAFKGHIETNAFRCAVNSKHPITQKIPE